MPYITSEILWMIWMTGIKDLNIISEGTVYQAGAVLYILFSEFLVKIKNKKLSSGAEYVNHHAF